MGTDFVFRENNTSYPNYAWPGVHAIIYKLCLEDIFEFDSNENIVNKQNIKEIGFKYGQMSYILGEWTVTEWTTVQLLRLNLPILYNDILLRVEEINLKPIYSQNNNVTITNYQVDRVLDYYGNIVNFEVPDYQWDEYIREKGTDSDSIEYIYAMSSNGNFNGNNDPSVWDTTSNDFQKKGYHGESDNSGMWGKDKNVIASGIGLLYVSKREKINNVWQAFSSPILFDEYQEDIEGNIYGIVPGLWNKENIVYIIDMDNCSNKINPVYITIDNLKSNSRYSLKGYYITSNNEEHEIGVVPELQTFPDFIYSWKNSDYCNIFPNVIYKESDINNIQDTELKKQKRKEFLDSVITIQNSDLGMFINGSYNLAPVYPGPNATEEELALYLIDLDSYQEYIDSLLEIINSEDSENLKYEIKEFFWSIAKKAMKVINDMGIWLSGTNRTNAIGSNKGRLSFRAMNDVDWFSETNFNINLFRYKHVLWDGNDNFGIIGVPPSSTWVERMVRNLGTIIMQVDHKAYRLEDFCISPLYESDREDRERICKGMEFLVHQPKALWGGESGEYPFLYTQPKNLGLLYRQVAGMFLNRHWWSSINLGINGQGEVNYGDSFYSRTDYLYLDKGGWNYDPNADFYVN